MVSSTTSSPALHHVGSSRTLIPTPPKRARTSRTSEVPPNMESLEAQLNKAKAHLFKMESELTKANSIIYCLRRSIAALQEELEDCCEDLKLCRVKY